MAQIIYIKTNVTRTPAHHNMINTSCLALDLLNSPRDKRVSAVFCSSLRSNKPDDEWRSWNSLVRWWEQIWKVELASQCCKEQVGFRHTCIIASLFENVVKSMLLFLKDKLLEDKRKFLNSKEAFKIEQSMWKLSQYFLTEQMMCFHTDCFQKSVCSL